MASRGSQLVLILGFLGVVFGVPAAQVAVELCRGERAQFTDLFRYAPTERNLRRFEDTLEGKWWGRQTVRPWMQWLLFAALRDTGAKAVAGRGGWLFYRPDVEYLTQRSRIAESSRASESGLPFDHRQFASVVRAILQVRDQLRQRGIHLLVVPVPGKASVYPERLTARAAGAALDFHSPTEGLLRELQQQGVETVDLFAAFREARCVERESVERKAQEAKDAPRSTVHAPRSTLYLARDTHWTPAGAKLAAEAVARRLRELGWAPPQRREYLTKRVRVVRHGDILEMMQIPGLQGAFPGEEVECEQVLDKFVGLMVPRASGREGTYANSHLRDSPSQRPAVLVLGDSFCRIYQLAEPQSLGEAPPSAETAGVSKTSEVARKRLLPGSAGFPSLLALALAAPVDYIVSDGGAATDVRWRLSVDPEILENKRVVVWTFAERDVALGERGWRPVPLPREL